MTLLKEGKLLEEEEEERSLVFYKRLNQAGLIFCLKCKTNIIYYNHHQSHRFLLFRL